jgi:hypothetical protein
VAGREREPVRAGRAHGAAGRCCSAASISTWRRWCSLTKITDKRFDPVSMLASGDEDDVLDALAGTLDFEDEDEWDWGAEHSEDDR